MSECHDIYDDAKFPVEAIDSVDGAQCHDLYGAVAAAPSAVTACPTILPVHECRIVETQQGPVRVVQVLGRLDWSTEGDFRDFMCDDCASPAVVVDLSGADEDAAGTGVLLAATARARKRGQQLVFVVPDHLEREVLLSTRLNEVAPVVRTEEEALAWLDAHGFTGTASAHSGGLAT